MALIDKNLQTGDVVLFHTKFKWNSPMSWLAAIIRKFIKFPYNHVGIIVNNWDKPFLNESNDKGVNSTVALDRLKDRKIKILRPKDIINEREIAIKANSRLGITKYDVLGLIFYQLIYKLTGKWVASSRTNNTERLMYCSEYAAWVYSTEFTEWYKVDPKDLGNSDFFETIYEN